MTNAVDPLPADLASAQAMILAERAARMAAEAKAAEAGAVRQGLTLEIERLKLEIARLRRERFGPSAERSARLEQLELSLEDLEEAAAEAQAAQAPDAGETTEVGGFTRRKPARRPLPEHLPRTRVVYPAPAICPCCGGSVRKRRAHRRTRRYGSCRTGCSNQGTPRRSSKSYAR